MLRGKEPVLSTCDRQFILEAIKEKKRLDGRSVYDYRHVTISPSHTSLGNVSVSIGNTKVQAIVTCQVVKPRPQRPTNGVLQFRVVLSPMASPSFELNRMSWLGVKIERLLEKCIRDTRAVDTESLCIIADNKVWLIKTEINVINDEGNVIDCSLMAAIVALKHFKRPEVVVNGEEATIYPMTEREPVPLNVHHMPLCVNFGFYHDGDHLLVDPTYEEERVMSGHLLIAMNVNSEICTLQMTGGVALQPDQITKCTKIAFVKVTEMTELIKSILKPSVVPMATTRSEIRGKSILVTTHEETSQHVDKLEDEKMDDDVHMKEEEPDVIILGENVGGVQAIDHTAELEKVLEGMERKMKRWEEGDDSEEETTHVLMEAETTSNTYALRSKSKKEKMTGQKKRKKSKQKRT